MASAITYSPLSDSDSDTEPTPTPHTTNLSNSIFKAYLTQSNSSTSHDLSKIQSFLTSSASGALSCLICLESIKPADPTWSCTSLCYAVFHLLCIQSWSRQSSDLSAARASSRLPISAEIAAQQSSWNCPKCRSQYSRSQIPKNYYCFCGKIVNPPSDPWILPHSCGEVCNRNLKNNCGHFCLLLCHPGPCPSCPKLVTATCYCGQVSDVRRCGYKLFSCGNKCNRFLDCGIHRCVEKCHEGACPPCRARGSYKCCCGKVEEERECCVREFQCGNACEKALGCGKHVCERGCHEGQCGNCPLQGKRSCPCGKRVYEGMACDVVVPLCGGTCDKLLNCGFHRCHERCHRGACVETCRLVVTKSCRCGGLKKQVACYQDLSCERKCQRMKDCGRHACKRRCCDGDCPPCAEVCGKRLRCKNHKCPAPCHQGPCAPCPLMVTMSCACGETYFEVPCGTEKEQKPPRCRKYCNIAPICRHASICKPHKCHYGGCPPCRLICEEEYPCGHACKLRCHGPTPPPNPEFTLKPKKKSYHPSECTPGSPCPPCPELVWVSCIGQHVGAERMMVCSERTWFACDNLCGNPLPCGNHYCTKTCHPLKNFSSTSVEVRSSVICEECRLPCEKERRPPCPHPCPRPCHSGDCPPCKVLVKRSCHCGTMVHVFECLYYNSLSEQEQIAVRSCTGRCHRKLPNCFHLCPETCHPGQCPSPEKCSKKVIVRCQCQTLKKEWLCQDVQAAYHRSGCEPKDVSRNQFGVGLLPCNSVCKSKVKVADNDLHLRKSKENDLEVKQIETEKHTRSRRKRRERVQQVEQTSKLKKIIAAMRTLILVVILLVTLLAASYFGYKGLMWLSDWMNEVDEQRRRRTRYPRI